ncbi:hypothetical protein FQN60_018026 [Etheostoma spectabile]|uniref:Uncharacterized protein n=1 Tax=Etheostoma spectabile TaxID=54343 RepID=A0A5J5DH19_9PERO|nr:hypothetical protein FQN60_018026 [Etheostoma spectabile]
MAATPSVDCRHGQPAARMGGWDAGAGWLEGHPKTRAFIIHRGTNGIYEAIYHGVPMVGIPIFADQPDNMVHIKAKGAAFTVAFNSIKTEDLIDGQKHAI